MVRHPAHAVVHFVSGPPANRPSGHSGHRPGGEPVVLPNTGGSGLGTFGARSRVGSGWIGYTVVGLVDLHDTGKVGVLATGADGNLWYYPGTGDSGTATFGTPTQVESFANGIRALDAAQLTDNGLASMLVIGPSGQLWFSDNTRGTGLNQFPTLTTVGSGWTGYTIN